MIMMQQMFAFGKLDPTVLHATVLHAVQYRQRQQPTLYGVVRDAQMRKRLLVHRLQERKLLLLLVLHQREQRRRLSHHAAAAAPTSAGQSAGRHFRRATGQFGVRLQLTTVGTAQY
jgi:hypothetical protein